MQWVKSSERMPNKNDLGSVVNGICIIRMRHNTDWVPAGSAIDRIGVDVEWLEGWNVPTEQPPTAPPFPAKKETRDLFVEPQLQILDDYKRPPELIELVRAIHVLLWTIAVAVMAIACMLFSEGF